MENPVAAGKPPYDESGTPTYSLVLCFSLQVRVMMGVSHKLFTSDIGTGWRA